MLTIKMLGVLSMKLFTAILISILTSPSVFSSENLDQYLFFNGVELEKSRISDVQKLFGSTEVKKKGDAADSYTGICYRVPNKNTTVYFESGEMGGGRIILTFKILLEDKSKFLCKEIEGVGVLELKLGTLSLGMDLSDAVKSLPLNTHSRRGLRFTYRDKIPFTKKQLAETGVDGLKSAFWDEYITIDLIGKGNMLTGFQVSKVTVW